VVRDEKLHLRIAPTEKRLVEAAAEVQGLPLAAFVRSAALSAARLTIRASERPPLLLEAAGVGETDRE
jgi:uncharacterized protein (DUF1778 family)